jgi:hypothetical protein
MSVWIPVNSEVTRPLPAPTIGFRSKVRASKLKKEISAINDQDVPSGSNDPSVLNYNWWPEKNKWEWIEYDFVRPQVISNTKVYWYDDGPDGGCRIPDEWEILYLNGNVWETVKANESYAVTKNDWDSVSFKPVKATAIKLKVKLNREYSAGVYEWVVE